MIKLFNALKSRACHLLTRSVATRRGRGSSISPLQQTPSVFHANREYSHQTGETDKIRLQLLNELYCPNSRSFLQPHLQRKHKILDVGCGQGQMTIWMASHTDQTVIGVDISESQLEVARSEASKKGISNVEFRNMSAFDIEKMPEEFDIIYGRFLLVHVQEPLEIIKAACKRLKPKGKILWEEAAASASFCEPPNKAFDKWLTLWRALREARNHDLDAGLRLPLWFRAAGLENITTQISQPILNTKKEKEILWRNTQSTKQAALDINFATAEEMEQLIEQLKSLTSEDHLIGFVRNSQSSGIKP